MATFNEIVKATGKDFAIEKSISGYYRLLLGDEIYHDDSACENVNEDLETAEGFYGNMLMEYEVPEDKKVMRCGVWFLK